jgi:integrase
MSWRVYYRQHGRLHRITIAHYPAVGVAKARKLAIKTKGGVFDGAHPVADRKAIRETWAETVGALIDAYGKSPAAKQRRWSEKSRMLENEIRPGWGDRRVKDIARRDVRILIEAKAQTAPVMANRLLATISAVFNFALDREWCEANPAARLKKPGQEGRRERVLTRNEIRELWVALTAPDPKRFVAAGVTLPHRAELDAFRMLLLGGQRLTETCTMRWSDLDLDSGWWTIPSVTAKNAQPHRVPLTEHMAKLLNVIKADGNRDLIFVFSRTPGASVAARSKKVAAILSRALGFSFTAHDLRRTTASYVAEAGVPRFNIACLLNHKSVTRHGVTSRYDLYQYDAEKRAALEVWMGVLAPLVGKEPR